MKDTKDIIACVCDHGRFLEVARRLARDVAKVYYWTPHESDCPSLSRGMIGTGFPEIERIADPLVNFDCDVFIFTDVGFTPMQQYFQHHGIPVFGHMGGDILEVNRGKFIETLKQLEMPVAEHVVIRGMQALRRHLRDQKDKYLKISKWRGDMESFHWRSWEEDASQLDHIAVKMGPLREHVTFYVFDPIDTKIEDGIDTFCVDGQLPGVAIHALEKKDKALLGTIVPFKDIDETIRGVSEKFAPVLGEFGYRGFFSTEIRVTPDGEAFFIDPTLRAGSPPHQVQCEMIANYGDVVWNAANGMICDPVAVKKFGVQAIVTSHPDENQWEEVRIPDDIRQWFKCGFATLVDGTLAIPPGLASHAMWMTAIGDTIKEAISALKEHAKQLPDHLTCEYHGLADLLREADEAEKQGMEFSSAPIPPPETVIKA